MTDLASTLRIMKIEMERNNAEMSRRLDMIESTVNKLRKKPKPSQVQQNIIHHQLMTVSFQLDTKKSMQLPSLINYDLQTTIESVAETVENIYG